MRLSELRQVTDGIRYRRPRRVFSCMIAFENAKETSSSHMSSHKASVWGGVLEREMLYRLPHVKVDAESIRAPILQGVDDVRPMRPREGQSGMGETETASLISRIRSSGV